MKITRTVSGFLVTISLLVPSHVANAQFGQLLGGSIGAVIGGKSGGGGAVAGAIIGVAMATILEQLSQQEQASRSAALNKAARSGKSSWQTRGKDGKKASYKRVGAVQEVGGQKCHKVKETITLADGKRGTSEDTVCFAS